MKFIILSSLLAVAIAQRPGYLSSGPVGYPGLANRFKDDSTSTTQNPLVNNRLGEPDRTTAKLPVDARGDSELVNRLNSWPRENRPFWILNADQIEAHRNTDRNQVNSQANLGNRQGNVQPFQANDRPFQGNGQGFQGNGQGFQGNDQFYPGNDQQFQSRFGPPDFRTDDFRNQVPSIPIRPVQTRGSFAGSL